MGFSFMYWDHFKQGGKIYISTQNTDDLGGYTEKELYVERVFADYKEEILSHINMENYQTLVQGKVDILMTSNKVKAMRSNNDGWDKEFEYDDAISRNHMTSLVLYTDLSEYCSSFSSTFRKSTKYESLESGSSFDSNSEWYF